MLLISWNVNGIRAALGKGFLEWFTETQPDVLCIQESRALPEQVKLETPGYEQHWYPAKRKGYSGTVILSKTEPVNVARGLGSEELDGEGRVLTAEFANFYLVNVYTPNSGQELARLDFRTKEWDPAFLEYLQKLEKSKPVVFCGDLNVAHKEIDIADPKSNRGNAGFTDEERANFDRIVAAGFIDTFREFHTDGEHYSWWPYYRKARERNRGWRIDYFCISTTLRPRLKTATIESHVTGSDHCPVTITLDA